ncbi:MAG: Mur ligase domain-containing protein, partial [Anaerolineae bacterium]
MSARILTLADVVEGLTGKRLMALEQPISTTVVDSRQVEPGALFIALRGEHADGHDYVADAFSRGAVAAIVERDVETEDLILDLTDPNLQSQISNLKSRIPLVIKVDDSLQ